MEQCNRCLMIGNIEGEMAEMEQEIEDRGGYLDGYDVLQPQMHLMELERDRATWAARPCECKGENVMREGVIGG